MDIESVLPHRYPFLFIDRIEACEPGRWARGIKNVTRNEWFMSGHFPGEPIMPGVLIAEAIAQTAAFAVKESSAASDRASAARQDEAGGALRPSIGMIASITGIRFHAPVVPGDRLELYFEIAAARGPFVKGRGEASVNGAVVASVEEIVIVKKTVQGEVRDERSARRQ